MKSVESILYTTARKTCVLLCLDVSFIFFMKILAVRAWRKVCHVSEGMR